MKKKTVLLEMDTSTLIHLSHLRMQGLAQLLGQLPVWILILKGRLVLIRLNKQVLTMMLVMLGVLISSAPLEKMSQLSLMTDTLELIQKKRLSRDNSRGNDIAF